MGPNTFTLGGRNNITNLNELRMEEGSSIGTGNMIKGWWDHPTEPLSRRNPSLYLAEHSQIASYHYIDCVDSLELGPHPAGGLPLDRPDALPRPRPRPLRHGPRGPRGATPG